MAEEKYCKFCGKKIPKDSIVCPKCGRQLELVNNAPKQETPKAEKPKKNSNAVKIIRYVVGGLLILACLGSPNFFSGLLIFVCGITVFPIFYEKVASKFIKDEKTLKILQIVIPIGLYILASIVIAASTPSSIDEYENQDYGQEEKQQEVLKEVEMADFSSMGKEEIQEWCNTNNIKYSYKDEYSDTVEKGKYIRQSVDKNTVVKEKSKVEIVFSLGKAPTKEQLNALKKAEQYADILHMSKKGIYDQLVSEYGEGFSKSDAQYAIDNLDWDWNANALEKAKSYRETLNMSKKKIYDQLISKYGEKFTKSEAQYAIDHLDD